jgi:hypothetical protein
VFPLRRERTHPSAVTDSTKRRLPSRQPRWVRAPGRVLAPTPVMVSKRDSQRHAGKREEAPASNAPAGAAPTTRRGMSPTPRAMARRPAARPVRARPGFRRRGRLSQKRREARTRRLADTASPPAPTARHAADALPNREAWAEGAPPGGYCSAPGSGPRATPRTADTHPSGARALGRRPQRGARTAANSPQRGASPRWTSLSRASTADTHPKPGASPRQTPPGAGPHERAAGVYRTLSGAGLRRFRAR